MKQIHNWGELAQLEPSATHYLDIDLELGCGRLRSSDGQYESYLSTHTFYGYGVMRYISEKLQACGFDVELIGWDKEPEVTLDCGYRNQEEQIRLVNERANNIDYNSPHFNKFNWHAYARECGISKRVNFKRRK